MRAALILNDEGNPIGRLLVDQDDDLELQEAWSAGRLFEVPVDSPALADPMAWQLTDGALTPSPTDRREG